MTRRCCAFTETTKPVKKATYNVWRYDLSSEQLIWAKATAQTQYHDGSKWYIHGFGYEYEYLEPFTGTHVPQPNTSKFSGTPGATGQLYETKNSAHFGLNYVRLPVTHNITGGIHYISNPPSYNMTDSGIAVSWSATAFNTRGGLTWVSTASGARTFMETDDVGGVASTWTGPSIASTSASTLADVLRPGFASFDASGTTRFYYDDGGTPVLLFSLSSTGRNPVLSTPNVLWQRIVNSLWVKTGHDVGYNPAPDVSIYSGFAGHAIIHLFSDDTILVRDSVVNTASSNRALLRRIDSSGSTIESVYCREILCVQPGSFVLIDPHPSSATASRNTNLIVIRSTLSGANDHEIDQFTLPSTSLGVPKAATLPGYLDGVLSIQVP